ncbi:maternal protein tudor [Musca vetustissima]|uniref:maternal protein tudor n=1 Tax=Musca vetustissima TaxID=27455 RepID=UPI002AB7B645|nr:maternal protein tudor [Musca vetustissima]
MSTSQGLNTASAASTSSSAGTTTTNTTPTLTNGGCAATTTSTSSNSSVSSSVAAAAAAGSSGSNNERKQRLFITHVDSLGPYLKISGQLNPDAMNVVRMQVQKILPKCYTIEPSWPVARQQALLLPGAMCLYKRINGAAPADFEFVRSRITKVINTATPAAQTPPKVEIDIIDYGCTATVVSYELLFPQNPEEITNVPTMCSQYIVLGICEDWKKTQLDELTRMISHHTVEVSIIKEFNQFKFITMKWKDFNIAEFLIHQKAMGAPIANDLLFENFSKILKQQQQKQQQQAAALNNNNMPSLNMNNQPKNVQNSNSNNNNNTNYYNKNYQQQPQQKPTSVVPPPILNSNNNNMAGGLAQQQQQILAAGRSSLSARLQQLQHPHLQQQHMQHMAAVQHGNMRNIMMSGPVQPRMPQSIGNLRSMMQGIHLQNNRIPFTGLHYAQQQPPPPHHHTLVSAAGTPGGGVAYNGLPGVMPTSVPQFNIYNARYQRPPPPQTAAAHLQQQQQQLGGMNNGIMAPTATTPLSPPRRTTPATFKSNNLVVGQIYDVSISFVENGPFLFSVQLITHQDDLTDMMNRIEKVELKPFSDKPMLGTACIARYSEDGQLYRALITGVQPMACKVAYIDYGNAEMVHFRDLYEIPEEFLKYKAFAIRFTLSGHKELEPIDDSLKKAFKDLVIYKNCKLKVMPLEGPPLVQYCELYMQDKNILHVLRQIQKTRLVYAKAEPLRSNDVVEIRYIDSPKNFYVQKVENIPAFEKLMDDMFLYYNKNQNVPNHLALGAPCIVKYENEWYRAEVMRADATAIIVRHVDFGYEQKVTKNLLSTIAEKHLKLPRQAVQCCLKGFENNELSKDLATTQFEMLAEESNRERRSFTVKVFRIQPDGVNLVNLCTKDLNVMKKLYKLSMPFEQYLSLEKEDFNVHKTTAVMHAAAAENGHAKTPSIASSTDMNSVHSSKKGQILNSTTVHSEELRMQNKQKHQQQQQQQSQYAQQQRNNQSFQGSVSTTEWDKNSSHSSMAETRDSRSTSSDFKPNQQQQPQQHSQRKQYYKNYPNHKQQQQQQQQYQQHSSNNSVASDKRSNASNYSSNKMMSANTPPRFQNKQKQQQQQQKQQRPQNAPQGFSQNQLKQHNQQQQQQQQQQKQQQNNKSFNSETSKKSTDTSSETSKKSQENASTKQQQQQQKEAPVFNFVPLNKAFPVKPLDTPCREEVIISWWISPHQFYTQLKSRSAEFERFMKEIQQFYSKLPLQQLQLRVGSYVMARQRKDNIIYRARILACNQMLRKYKVHFVDFGNMYTVTSEDIWPVEKKFADFPIMAYLCGFDGIVSNYDHLYIIDRMDKYLPQGVTLQCEYIEKNTQNDLYFVNVMVNKVSLKETLKNEKLITEICPELRLELLAGQQIRAKISSIKDMLNFKIELPFYGCDNIKHIEVLCSYDDVRFVKSNQDIAKKFKQFYVGKSCVFNIKDVNDNKVILLRPLLPLLKEDIPWYICTAPILLDTFKIRVGYVSTAYRVYGQIIATETEMAQLLDDMYNHYENQGTLLQSFEPEKVCAAKGSDGNWYRGRILNNKTADGPVEVLYIDYGNTEMVEKKDLKQLEEKFYLNKNAYGVEINLPMKTLSAEMQQKQKGKKSGNNQAATNGATNETDIAVINKLTSLTLDQEITVKCLEVKNNHLIAELIMADGRNMIDMLKGEKLIKSRDLDFMRKLLEKEKPNQLEYIECVDLTIEDEEEESNNSAATAAIVAVVGDKNKNKKPASPKKKKAVKEAAVEKEIKPVEVKVEVTEKKAEPAPKAEESKKSIVSEKSNEVEKPATAVVPPPTPAAAPAKEVTPTPEKSITPEPVVNPFADWEHAVLAHCDNPAQFFIHPMDKVKDLQKLQENLQIVASSLPPLMRVINGAYCISMYSVDKQWYRAKILDAELMVLQFIDFGNTDCVSDSTDLKEMLVFPDVEPLCIPCALPIRPNGSLDWQDAANGIFNDSYNKILDYEFITHGEQFKKSYLNLYIEGVNVTEKLIENGYAKPLELVESGLNCYISHVNGISDFYIQYEKDSKGLELIEIYLADNEKLKKLEKFEKNKIVAALFPDDEMWYRAKLLRQVPDGYEVLFIDYGNTSISPECREISQDIAELPPLSKKCALEVPENCKSWSDAAEQKFMEIADTGETIFSVELREPAKDHAIVHLLIDGHNINNDLQELCEKKPLAETGADLMNTSFNSSSLQTSVCETECYHAFVSHVNSPCDFYVQFTRDTAQLEEMTQVLNSTNMEALEKPTKLQLCAAVYPEDNSLYRARIVELLPENQYRVLFIDFGNEAVTSELKTLPQDLLNIKSLSTHCQLENYAKFLQFGSIATEIFNNLINQWEGQVRVGMITEAEGNVPAIVKVLALNGNENLCDLLNKQLGLDHNTQTMTQEAVMTEEELLKASKTCLISHAISPSHFYIQLKSNSGKMEQLAKSLSGHKVKSDCVELKQAELGMVCVVFSTEDDRYYRGRIEKILADDKGYEVFLLDFGNTIVSTDIREMSEELRAIPSMALRCQLNNIPSNVSESVLEERFATLIESHFGDYYDIEEDVVADEESRLHIVKLQVNYKDLAEELQKAVESDAAGIEEAFSPLPELHDCSIIHVNSPQSFYVQLSKDVSALEKVTDVLLDAESDFAEFTDISVGALCAAEFPEDGAYYRAEIVALLEDNKCEVHYIDFGNNSVTDKLRKLPEDLLKLERYSKHCSLDSTCPQTAEVQQQFAQFVDTRFSETFQLEFLKSSDALNIVRLFYQEKNVIQELQNQMMNGGGAADGGNDASSGLGTLSNGFDEGIEQEQAEKPTNGDVAEAAETEEQKQEQ